MTDFFEKAKQKYNNKFDYSKAVYINTKNIITIICPLHGEFEQLPLVHLRAVHGCPTCARNNTKAKGSLEEFIKKAELLHGKGTYDYSKVKYINSSTHVTVVCPKHGEWLVTPGNHLNKNKFSCPQCSSVQKGLSKRKTTEQFIAEAKTIHGDKYDYSKSIYTKAHEKLIVICPEHGEWQVSASNHTNNKSGCPSCGAIKRTISGAELIIEKYLIANNIKYKREVSFEDFINPKTNQFLRFDFWLYENNIIIEYDGEHHFHPVQYGMLDSAKLFEYTQYKDNLKNTYCKQKGIQLTRIPYTYRNEKQIVEYLRSIHLIC